MPTIHKLDQQTINSIAAGEVVERPASVAKELIENSLDAAASLIRISLRNGGIKFLEVEDDGCGMTEEDAKMAVESHATSKLRTADDLLRVETMGFRGEALASIAAVSRLELRSRQIGTEEGTRVLLEGGNLVKVEPTGMQEGTIVSVRDLFYNTPARYKFLKKDKSEENALVKMVGGLALARPDVSFRVHRLEDNKDLLHTPGNNDLLSAIYAVYGRDLAENMLEVKGSVGPIKLSGYMTGPDHARHNRSRQTFIVNERVIESPTLRAAADEARKTWFMKGRFPAFVFHIKIPAELIDVNVHPQKSEIRVWNERELFRAVYHSMRDCLERSQDVKDALEFQDDSQDGQYSVGAIESEQDAASGKGKTATTMPVDKDNVKSTLTNKAQRKESAEAEQITFSEKLTKKSLGKRPEGAREPSKPSKSDKSPEAKRKSSSSNFTDWQYIGSFVDTYLLFEEKDNLLIVDQHAAHERILYEQLLQNYRQNSDKKALSQNLLLPVRINLSADEIDFYQDYKEQFEQLGFICEIFGDNALVIRAVPSSGSDKNVIDPAAALRAVLERAIDKSEPNLVFNDTEVFHDIACKAAVKANDKLSPAEVTSLLMSLEKLDNPYHCPHGRPVIIRISRQQLEKKFGRIN